MQEDMAGRGDTLEDIHNTLKDIKKNMSCMILSTQVWNKIEKLWNGWFDRLTIKTPKSKTTIMTSMR